MTQPAKVQEPSMEEILASIRRIIADDEAKPAGRREARQPAAPHPPSRRSRSAAPPAAKPPVMKDIPPSAIAPRRRKGAAAAAPSRAAAGRAASRPPPTARTTSTRCWPASTRRRRRPRYRPPQPDGEVFELTDEMALPDPPPPQRLSFHKIEPQDDLEFTEAAAARALHRQPAYRAAAVRKPAAPPPQQILSRSTVSAVESAFNSLANTVLSNNARTLEDLVKEMLRPMLKSWLDDNLPGLVERIVKAEIERVSRGR